MRANALLSWYHIGSKVLPTERAKKEFNKSVAVKACLNHYQQCSTVCLALLQTRKVKWGPDLRMPSCVNGEHRALNHHEADQKGGGVINIAGRQWLWSELIIGRLPSQLITRKLPTLSSTRPSTSRITSTRDPRSGGLGEVAWPIKAWWISYGDDAFDFRRNLFS